MAVRRSWGITLASITLLLGSMSGLPTALADTAPVPVIPIAPTLLTPKVGVDGVALTWARGSVTAAGSTPTSYVVHRRAAGIDLDWEVATCCDATSWSSNDTTIPTGATATYTVVARNAAGDSQESNPQTVTVPTWNGPFTPANRSLTLVWDSAFSNPAGTSATVQIAADASPGLQQNWDGGAMAFSAAASTSSPPPLSLDLQTGLSDGTYPVGRDSGQINIRASAGISCDLPSTGATPGTATVHNAAPSMSGGYASITVDAVLNCGNGHTMHAYLRWATPDATVGLTTAPLTVTQADPQTQSTVDVPVRNTGNLPVTLGAASLSPTYTTSSDPLSVVASTCDGVTLDPGLQCTVTVQYTAGAAQSHEGNDYLDLASDVGTWQLGRVVGQQPSPWSGAQNLAFSSAPGHVDLTWGSPWTGVPIDHWRVDDLTTGTAPSGGTYLTNTGAHLHALAAGPHSLQVVLVSTDGREIKAAPLSVTVPLRWLLIANAAGVQAFDPDGAVTNGGLLGGVSTYGATPRNLPAESVVASPTRNAEFVEESQGDVAHYDATGTFAGLLPAGTTDTNVADRQLSISPDGSRIAALRPQVSGSTTRPASIVLIPAGSGVATTVPNSADLSSPSWTPDGHALLASVGQSTALARVDPTTGARAIVPGTAGASLVAVSRTGRVAFQLGTFDAPGEIRLTGLSGGASTLLGVQQGATSLAWDPTGRWLAVTSGAYGQPASTTTVYDTQSSTPLVRSIPAGGSSVAWLDTASLAPNVTLGSPAWTKSTASVAVTAADPDDGVGGLRRECQLDGGAWAPCSDPWTLTNLAAGSHTAQARVTDPSGQQSAVVSRSWHVDTAAPTAAIAPLPWVPLTTAPVLSWSGVDTGGSGLSSYEIRERAGALSGAIGGYQYPSVWTALTGQSMTLRVAPGMQYCFSIRARDVAGNVGPWSAERCTSIAVDDRALTASTGWTRGLASTALYGTWSRAAHTGSTLSIPSVQGRRIAVIATTCSTCGAVDVYHAGVWLGRVNLYTSTTQYRQVRWLPLEPVTRIGAVVLKTASAAPVLVDAIADAH